MADKYMRVEQDMYEDSKVCGRSNRWGQPLTRAAERRRKNVF